MARFKGSFLYLFISLILFASSFYKAEAFVLNRNLDWLASGKAMALIGLELFLAIWLVSGLFPIYSRMVALTTFAAFLNYSLFQALTDQPSCECFGKLQIRPWVMVGLDALVVLSLVLVSSPPEPSDKVISRKTRWTFSLASLGLVTLLGLSIATFKTSFSSWILSTGNDVNEPLTVNPTQLEKVLKGIEANYNNLNRIKYHKETTITIHPTMKYVVSPTMKELPKTELAKYLPASVETVQKLSTSTLIDKDRIWSETIAKPISQEDGQTEERTLLSFQNQTRVQYHPEKNQAWLSQNKSLDEGASQAVDIRLAGFVCPIDSITSYLTDLEKSGVDEVKQQTPNRVIRITGLSKNTKQNPFLFTGDFDSQVHFLPTRIMYRFYPDKSLLLVTDIEYQKINEETYFPKVVQQRTFMKGATKDPDAKTGQSMSIKIDVVSVIPDPPVTANEFDIELGPRTKLKGDLRLEPTTGEKSVLVSQMLRPDSIAKEVELVQEEQFKTKPNQFRWVIMAGVNLLILILLLSKMKGGN